MVLRAVCRGCIAELLEGALDLSAFRWVNFGTDIVPSSLFGFGLNGEWLWLRLAGGVVVIMVVVVGTSVTFSIDKLSLW